MNMKSESECSQNKMRYKLDGYNLHVQSSSMSKGNLVAEALQITKDCVKSAHVDAFGDNFSHSVPIYTLQCHCQSQYTLCNAMPVPIYTLQCHAENKTIFDMLGCGFYIECASSRVFFTCGKQKPCNSHLCLLKTAYCYISYFYLLKIS